MASRSKPELFLSVDIEADGKIPVRNSMLSFGAAGLTPDKELIDTFTRNLELLPGAVQDPDTMDWWNKPENRPFYESSRRDVVAPALAMREFHDWVNNLRRHYDVVPVAFPGLYDGSFLRQYAVMFAGQDTLGFSILCLKSQAATMLGSRFRDAGKRNFPGRWYLGCPEHTHLALDDAVEQGCMAVNMIREVRGLSPVERIVNLCGYQGPLDPVAPAERS